MEIKIGTTATFTDPAGDVCSITITDIVIRITQNGIDTIVKYTVDGEPYSARGANAAALCKRIAQALNGE